MGAAFAASLRAVFQGAAIRLRDLGGVGIGRIGGTIIRGVGAEIRRGERGNPLGKAGRKIWAFLYLNKAGKRIRETETVELFDSGARREFIRRVWRWHPHAGWVSLPSENRP